MRQTCWLGVCKRWTSNWDVKRCRCVPVALSYTCYSWPQLSNCAESFFERCFFNSSRRCNSFATTATSQNWTGRCAKRNYKKRLWTSQQERVKKLPIFREGDEKSKLLLISAGVAQQFTLQLFPSGLQAELASSLNVVLQANYPLILFLTSSAIFSSSSSVGRDWRAMSTVSRDAMPQRLSDVVGPNHSLHWKG